jgi:sarcosine oxidase subunit alpha
MPIPLSLAASWLKNGHAAITRSFRFHRPRGAFCHRGWCQQCKVRLPDGSVTLACNSTGRGQETAAPDRDRDWLRLAGALAERTRPWFYERQRLGGLWQQAFVKTVRALSAALPLAARQEREPRRPTLTHDCNTLVIGGGPAGVLAADALAHAGRSCVLVQAGELGGTARKLFGKQSLPWPELDNRATTFDRLDRHLCVGLYEDARRALCVGPEGNVLVRFDELVVATGAYDRMPTVEGNDLPGVVGLRGYERLVAQGAIAEGCRVGIYAGMVEAARAASVAQSANLSLVFVAGPASLPSLTCPTKTGTRLRRIVGSNRVTGVVLDDETTHDCDLFVVGFTQPSYEFQAQNGCAVELVGDPPIVRAVGPGRTRMLVVGEASGWTDPKDLASKVRAAVANWLANDSDTAPDSFTTHAIQQPSSALERPADAAFVCFCEDVRVGDIRAAVAEGYGDVELVKRHTGAGTGPCQGKLCHASLLACMAEAGADVRIPTPRPLLRPVSLRQLAGDGSCIGDSQSSRHATAGEVE